MTEYREVARWTKPSLMGKGTDALILLADDRGRTLIQRRPYHGVPFQTITIPLADRRRREFTDRPPFEDAEAFAIRNGYERRGS